MPTKQPAYQTIKHHVLAQIHAGTWRNGEAIPGEEALARSFGVSRMTVHRALRELSDEQVVERIRGSGTYVAQQKYQSTLVTIRNIAEDIAARGQRHRSELHLLERTRADDALARAFQADVRSPLYHSVVLHYENDAPIQVEDRYVHPRVAPDYLVQDFSCEAPNAYLTKVAPPQGVDFEIEATHPPPFVGELLGMVDPEPCLVLRRTTYSLGQVASLATLWHPAARFRFTGKI